MPARQHVRLHVRQSRVSDQFLEDAAQPTKRHREARAFATTCDRLGRYLARTAAAIPSADAPLTRTRQKTGRISWLRISESLIRVERA